MGNELTEQEEKALESQKISDRLQKVQEIVARQDADAENGWNIFLAKHSGQQAITRRDVFVPNQANCGLLEEWLTEQGALVNEISLERAFVACRQRLSKFHQDDYVRRIDLQTSRIAPQVKTFAPPQIRAPYTRAEVLSWSLSRLRLEVRRFGNAEIDRILREGA